jgi:hypothetical protein
MKTPAFISTAVVSLAVISAPASAQRRKAVPPPPATPPAALIVGQPWSAFLAPQWLEDAPSTQDASGKVVMHWFCGPKVALCRDDLARVLTLREAGKIYVIAYIMGTKRDAKKLDPVGDAVGVGTVGFGPKVAKLMGQYGMGTGPAAIIVDVDGKVAHIANGGDPAILDARDKKINELVGAIKEFSVGERGPTVAVKTGERFELGIDIELASWLSFDRKAITDFTITVSPDFKCDTLSLKGEQVKVDGRKLTATIGCTVTGTGAYEARGRFRFGYNNPNGTTALGQDSVGWKFAVTAAAATTAPGAK